MGVMSGMEWGCGISIRLLRIRCEMRSSLIPYIVGGRILKNREERARGVPMIEHTKREREGESLGREAGEMSLWVTKGDSWCCTVQVGDKEKVKK